MQFLSLLHPGDQVIYIVSRFKMKIYTIILLIHFYILCSQIYCFRNDQAGGQETYF